MGIWKESNEMNQIKKTWMITAVLLAISSIYGFAAFMVGREAYGKMVKDSHSDKH